MTLISRAGLATRCIALGAVLFVGLNFLVSSAQAAPVPAHANSISNTNTGSVHVPPVTAPVPNARFVGPGHGQEEQELVHLRLHSHLGSAPERGTIVHVHDAADSSSEGAHKLVRRKGGGAKGKGSPPPASHPAPAQHAAAKPPPAQHAAAKPAPAAPPHHHESVAAKIRGAFHKIGDGIKHAAQAVGHFVKTTGAKIAKVGLKIVATAQKLASKVVGWLPIPGAKAVGRLMEGESEGLNKASDAIHAHIGGKLGQAMHRMDTAQKVAGYIPRSYIPEGDDFEEREFGDAEVEERDEEVEERDEEVDERDEDFEERDEEFEEREDELEDRDMGNGDLDEFTAREMFNFAERSLDDDDVYMF